MAINKNHEFEELDSIKCAIVERNISGERAMFLKNLLVDNGYTVVMIPAPPPKTAAAKTASPAAPPQEAASTDQAIQAPPPPELFTLGVTNLAFNPINAIFGRLLKTPNGHVVTQAYWDQEEDQPTGEETPYYEHTELKSPEAL